MKIQKLRVDLNEFIMKELNRNGTNPILKKTGTLCKRSKQNTVIYKSHKSNFNQQQNKHLIQQLRLRIDESKCEISDVNVLLRIKEGFMKFANYCILFLFPFETVDTVSQRFGIGVVLSKYFRTCMRLLKNKNMSVNVWQCESPGHSRHEFENISSRRQVRTV